LRAVAVLAVLLYHTLPGAIPGGFAGVDIFFVISGFVITNTILRDMSEGRFSVARFYRRRVRRIFPALYATLAVFLVASWFFLPPSALYELGKSMLAMTFFSSNFYFLRHSGYFDTESTLRPLLHTWSLSVEEQFYLLYPLLIVLICRLGRKLLLPLLIVAFALSLTLSIWLIGNSPIAAFYLAPARAFELLLGGIVSGFGAMSSRRSWRIEATSLLGLALVAGSLTFLNQRIPFPGLAAIPPCLGAAFLLWTGEGTLAGKLLSTRPLTFFGDMSYSLYLWHWPILVLARLVYGSDLSFAKIAGCVSAAIILAASSRRFVELPFLAESRRALPFLRLGAAALAIGAAASLALVATQGAPQRFSPKAQAIFASATDYNPRRDRCHSGDNAPIPYDAHCTFGAAGSQPDTAVWGDSHGAELAVAVGERMAPLGRSTLEITTSACPPATGYQPDGRPFCVAANAETLARLLADRRVLSVILACEFSTDGDFAGLLQGYEDVVHQLRTAGKRVVVIYPIPMQRFDPPSMLGMLVAQGNPIDAVGLPQSEYLADNRHTLAFLDAMPDSSDLQKVIPAKLLCKQNLCRTYLAGSGVLYFDSGHLSLAGARVVAAAIPLN
jgi:peptidoglycan/LPS O-acetylase OafA/YrhL